MIYPLIWIEQDLTVRNIRISNVFRVEEHVKTPTVCVDRHATVENMVLDNIVQENRLSEPFPLLENNGIIGRLFTTGLRTNGDTLTAGYGTIQTVTGDDIIN